MSDKETKEQLSVLKKGTKQVSSSKAKALEFLKMAGILTESGNLSKSYKAK